MTGALKNIACQILNGYGCNTTRALKRLLNKSWHIFQLTNREYVIQHSKGDSNELITDIILNWTLRTGQRTDETSWLESGSRHDIMLGMPWHIKSRPAVDNVKRAAGVSSAKKCIDTSKKNEENVSFLEVAYQSVKTFC